MNCDKTFLSIFSLMKPLLKFPTFSVIKLFDGVLYTGRYYKWHSLSFLISLYGAVTHLSTSTNTSLASTLSSQHLCLASSASSRVSWPPLFCKTLTLWVQGLYPQQAGHVQAFYRELIPAQGPHQAPFVTEFIFRNKSRAETEKCMRSEMIKKWWYF